MSCRRLRIQEKKAPVAPSLPAADVSALTAAIRASYRRWWKLDIFKSVLRGEDKPGFWNFYFWTRNGFNKAEGRSSGTGFPNWWVFCYVHLHNNSHWESLVQKMVLVGAFRIPSFSFWGLSFDSWLREEHLQLCASLKWSLRCVQDHYLGAWAYLNT